MRRQPHSHWLVPNQTCPNLCKSHPIHADANNIKHIHICGVKDEWNPINITHQWCITRRSKICEKKEGTNSQNISITYIVSWKLLCYNTQNCTSDTEIPVVFEQLFNFLASPFLRVCAVLQVFRAKQQYALYLLQSRYIHQT